MDTLQAMRCYPLAFFNAVVLSLFCSASWLNAERLGITISAPAAASTQIFQLGTPKRPDGATLTVDGRSLLLNGQRWTPSMGEFHYTRYPESEWRDELLKMKAGGIQIVATYVFWIHHEEVKGEWDWSGQRNLRGFIELCRDVGMDVVVRCGPWCHGEVRNGGLPDWIVEQTEFKPRSLDAGFMAATRELYTQIAHQLDGLLWKDGGPVVGIQLDNEYSDPAEYLVALKKMARELGLDVPIYTRTGWPELKTPMPFGEILPLFGVYAEGFWDRELDSMPGNYWTGFRFSAQRLDDNIANEQLGRKLAKDAQDTDRYPYLTCEIGGGMVPSYHRRILVDPADIESTVLVKIGSGSSLPGYYMYHGGTNPQGKRTTLMEAQDTPSTNWNDMPVRNYDFEAPLGQYGQVRPQYHLLRRLHLFLHDFGTQLAETSMSLPNVRPQGKDDTTTLRWAVRSNGRSGFVFVNNYERSRPLPPKPDVQFEIKNADGSIVVFPEKPITVSTASRFFWPYGLDLGHGVRLSYATAQPLCFVDEPGLRTVFFAETTGVPAVFSFDGEAPRTLHSSLTPSYEIGAKDGSKVQIVLLDEPTSLCLYKGQWLGRERAFLSKEPLSIEPNKLWVTTSSSDEVSVDVYPVPEALMKRSRDGIFVHLTAKPPARVAWKVTANRIRPAGTPREIPLGKISKPVAAEPTDGDFGAAAVWEVQLPKDLDLSVDPLLRVNYAGDVARATLDGEMITDDFYKGTPWEIGLRRYAAKLREGKLELAVLPLRKDAVVGTQKKIFMADSALPDFASRDSIAEIRSVELVPRYRIEIKP